MKWETYTLQDSTRFRKCTIESNPEDNHKRENSCNKREFLC